ncbi:L-ascorbate metabolism protein UlaG, beta-lactamase superfamily [Rhizobiales bacterium GAS191]|nr:L-ascorbate metabolism protein UlaG, beta-lactamase superfamily [Rhizobiales bacterium GAS113]SED14805.1 L-ascorbate metabolism protein UlaG, beta-lactamase superfamily [Rhizobiales bacterium GAS191]
MPRTIGDQTFLRPDVKIELLVGRWFAWSHLIAPVQHAMNIAFRHLPLMQSFVAAPQVHIAAANAPNMLGGPFLDLPANAVPEIKALIQQTSTQFAELIAFARDFKSFDQALQDGANGFCLSEFYDRMPESLAGATEVCYDLNNNPALRVIEEIIYKHRLDNRPAQEICLSQTKDTDRKFFMTTPRVSGPGRFFAAVDFSSAPLDIISSMRTHVGSLDEVSKAFEVAPSHKEIFESFFTTEAPERKTPNYVGDDVRVRYFGHACVLIQTAHTSILIDPTVTWDSNVSDGRFTFMDLPDVIDFVVISHSHQDHFSPELLVQLRHRVRRIVVPRNGGGNIADPSMKLILQRLGYTNIDVVDAFDAIRFDEGEIISLPFSGEHADLNIHSKQTIFINIKGRRFFFLVDSDAIDPGLYRLVTEIVGRPDTLFVGMECFGAPLTWLYGPLLTKPISRRNDESRRLSASNCERAWRLVKDLGCSKAFIYAMGQEPWLRYLMGLEYKPDAIQLKQARSFVERCVEAGLEIEHLDISREMFY